MLVMLFCFTACVSRSKQINKVYLASINGSNAVPNEIGGEDYVLLVQKTGVRKMDRIVRRHLENHYRGKVQEIYFPEIEEQEGYKLRKAQPLGTSSYYIKVDPKFEGEFADVEKYRFYLGIDYRVYVNKRENPYRDENIFEGGEIFPDTGESPYSTNRSYEFTFYILDRQKGKTYVCPGGAMNFSNKFEGYIKALEQVRKQGK